MNKILEKIEVEFQQDQIALFLGIFKMSLV